jgi:hypothetical protein
MHSQSSILLVDPIYQIKFKSFKQEKFNNLRMWKSQGCAGEAPFKFNIILNNTT